VETDGPGSGAFAASHRVGSGDFSVCRSAANFENWYESFIGPWGPAFDDRIHLDILEICVGNAERVRELVELAKVDWRDLIKAAV
jgi:hypothetical protein